MSKIEKLKTVFQILFKRNLNLNPNEMAFRSAYFAHLKSSELTTVFRPGKRDKGEKRGYRPNQEVIAKIIDKVGADWAFVPPKFVPNFSRRIIITNTNVKRFSELTQSDFDGSSPDIKDELSLRYHLGVVYNRPIDVFKDDSFVTVINFAYQD